MIRLLTFFIAALLIAPQTALANRAALKCVQAQLNKLEFGAGSVDGSVGPKTRAAYGKLKAEIENVEFDAKLSRDNAIVLCRELGLLQPKLRVIWPSFTKRFETSYQAKLSDENQQILTQLVTDALNQLAKKYNVILAGKFNVLAATDNREMRRLVEKSLGGRIDRNEFHQFMERTCPETKKISGFASTKHIAVCFPQGSLDIKRYDRNNPGEVDPNWNLLKDVVFHEVVHIAQRQLAGFSGRGTEQAKLSKMGPEWLVEGVAQYLTMLALSPDLSVDAWMKGVKALAGGHSADISKYNGYAARRKYRDSLYLQGLLASHHLYKIAGDHALLDYYHNIGIGMAWEDAFKASFKVTPKQFYAMFAAS
jgi:hypothetical protein